MVQIQSKRREGGIKNTLNFSLKVTELSQDCRTNSQSNKSLNVSFPRLDRRESEVKCDKSAKIKAEILIKNARNSDIFSNNV